MIRIKKYGIKILVLYAIVWKFFIITIILLLLCFLFKLNIIYILFRQCCLDNLLFLLIGLIFNKIVYVYLTVLITFLIIFLIILLIFTWLKIIIKFICYWMFFLFEIRIFWLWCVKITAIIVLLKVLRFQNVYIFNILIAYIIFMCKPFILQNKR